MMDLITGNTQIDAIPILCFTCMMMVVFYANFNLAFPSALVPQTTLAFDVTPAGVYEMGNTFPAFDALWIGGKRRSSR